jgi:hypothetical protein
MERPIASDHGRTLTSEIPNIQSLGYMSAVVANPIGSSSHDDRFALVHINSRLSKRLREDIIHVIRSPLSSVVTVSA